MLGPCKATYTDCYLKHVAHVEHSLETEEPAQVSFMECPNPDSKCDKKLVLVCSIDAL